MPDHDAIDRAFDEARFGPARTLNLREGMPTGADAARRAELWLRAKQVERAGEVLVVTGRGRGSVGGVPVVREAVHKVLGTLRRKGVVAEWSEHTPGSFVVRVASMRALVDAPRRMRGGGGAPRPADPEVLRGLTPATRDRLRELSVASLHALGVRSPDDGVVHDEMLRQFAALSAGIPQGVHLERLLAEAIGRALDEHHE